MTKVRCGCVPVTLAVASASAVEDSVGVNTGVGEQMAVFGLVRIPAAPTAVPTLLHDARLVVHMPIVRAVPVNHGGRIEGDGFSVLALALAAADSQGDNGDENTEDDEASNAQDGAGKRLVLEEPIGCSGNGGATGARLGVCGGNGDNDGFAVGGGRDFDAGSGCGCGCCLRGATLTVSAGFAVT